MRHTGAWCWVVAAPLLVGATVIAGLPWNPAYSWSEGNLSDLGNAACGTWDTTRPRYVCSPWHGFMNAAILVTAVLLAIGAITLLRDRLARVLLLLAAGGYALAGAFPANVDQNAHFLGAALILVVGNIGLVVAAFGLPNRPEWLSYWTLIMGSIALLGTVLFLSRAGLGIGVGGMQRIAVFPLLMWTFVVGLHTLASSSSFSGERRRMGSRSTPLRSLPLSSQEMPKAQTEMTSPR